MNSLTFSSREKVLFFAPHPDDESIGSGVLLQRAARAGASIRVIYATEGENNPWPQRVLERKWRLRTSDCARWGKMRRVEALGALQILGVGPDDARFLDLPDQRLTHLLKRGCERLLKRLAGLIMEFQPTHLFVPSIADTHPDHSAFGVMLRLVLGKYFSSLAQMQVWGYLVHGKSESFHRWAMVLPQSEQEKRRKRLAISCHKSQIKLSRRRFLAYADRPEKFLPGAITVAAAKSILRPSTVDNHLRIDLRIPVKPLHARDPVLVLLGRSPEGRLCCGEISIPRQSATVQFIDLHDQRVISLAQYRGNKFAGELVLPTQMFSSDHALFAKLERRSWFFDEAGWTEIPPLLSSKPVCSQSSAAGETISLVHNREF